MNVYSGHENAGLDPAGYRRTPAVTPALNLKSIGMFCEPTIGAEPSDGADACAREVMSRREQEGI